MKPSDKPRRRRPVYNRALGRAIKVVRTEQGIGRRELAERSGISYSYLAEIENGNKPPSSQVLLAISEALGLRPSELHAVVDSLQTGRSPVSNRQAEIAASAERAWGPQRSYQAAAELRQEVLSPAPSPDRQAILDELHRRLELMSDEDLEMLLRMADRFGRR